VRRIRRGVEEERLAKVRCSLRFRVSKGTDRSQFWRHRRLTLLLHPVFAATCMSSSRRSSPFDESWPREAEEAQLESRLSPVLQTLASNLVLHPSNLSTTSSKVKRPMVSTISRPTHRMTCRRGPSSTRPRTATSTRRQPTRSLTSSTHILATNP
jgi:hypothetical protein